MRPLGASSPQGQRCPLEHLDHLINLPQLFSLVLCVLLKVSCDSAERWNQVCCCCKTLCWGSSFSFKYLSYDVNMSPGFFFVTWVSIRWFVQFHLYVFNLLIYNNQPSVSLYVELQGWESQTSWKLLMSSTEKQLVSTEQINCLDVISHEYQIFSASVT